MAEVADAIDKYDFGGVILFAENVKETKQTLALTQDMQKAAIENKANNGKIPLLLGYRPRRRDRLPLGYGYSPSW